LIKVFIHHLKRGKLTLIGRPLWNILIGTELLYFKRKNKEVIFKKTHLVDEKLTAIIKTFERQDTLKRLIKSIKLFYPHMRIIVVDDSKVSPQIEGVKLITIPYDSGVSVGRQMALDNVKTPYTLILDDDFVFYYHTELEPAMEIMEANTNIDIMGGEVVDLPLLQSADYSNAPLHPSLNKSLHVPGSKIAGFPIFNKVPNFYIARTERLKLVGWDKDIKRLDHADFFTRAKGVLTTIFNKNFKVLHAQTPFNKNYMKKRNDIGNDKLILFMKYYNKM